MDRGLRGNEPAILRHTSYAPVYQISITMNTWSGMSDMMTWVGTSDFQYYPKMLSASSIGYGSSGTLTSPDTYYVFNLYNYYDSYFVVTSYYCLKGY
jgi:hypothetical protein